MATVPFPAYHAHPDVWFVVGSIAAAYVFALVRLGPRLAPTGTSVVTRLQASCFAAGLLALLVGSGWPIHDLAEGYLFSVHMVQHATFSIIAAPLFLLGTPTWLARFLLSPSWLLASVRFLARLLPATILFNVVVVVTHVPAVVDASVHSEVFHFVVHTVVFGSALIVWMPLLSPLPEVPRFQPLLQMLFLFLQSVVPTVPASFLTFGERPLYRFYETVPRVWEISALDDMRLAGLIMKIGVGTALWVIIAIVFFRWYNAEEAGVASRRVPRSLEHELTGLHR